MDDLKNALPLKALKHRKGIWHLNDLSNVDFLSVISNLHNYEKTEKIDGSNIQFGIDDRGFYTSREDKLGERIYNEADYEINYATTFQRSVHLALQTLLPQLALVGVVKGIRVEVEVLYGKLPNTVPYLCENKIILLRVVEGLADVARISTLLASLTVSVTLCAPFTTDGLTIQIKEKSDKWTFGAVESVAIKCTPEINDSIASYTSFLTCLCEDTGYTNFQILENDFVTTSTSKKIIKDKKTELEKINIQLRLDINALLITTFIKDAVSIYGPSKEQGGWIEGYVFRHKTQNKVIKLVDKEMFTKQNKCNYEFRGSIRERPRSVTSERSFYGNYLILLAQSIGHPNLGTIQAKRYITKFGNNSRTILEGLNLNLNINEVKAEWNTIHNSEMLSFKYLLSRYLQDPDPNEEINIRNLQECSTIMQKIEIMSKKTQAASSMDEIILLLIQPYLDN